MIPSCICQGWLQSCLIRGEYHMVTHKLPSPQPAGLAHLSQGQEGPRASKGDLLPMEQWDESTDTTVIVWAEIAESIAHEFIPSTGFLAKRSAAPQRLSPPRPVAFSMVADQVSPTWKGTLDGASDRDQGQSWLVCLHIPVIRLLLTLQPLQLEMLNVIKYNLAAVKLGYNLPGKRLPSVSRRFLLIWREADTSPLLPRNPLLYAQSQPRSQTWEFELLYSSIFSHYFTSSTWEKKKKLAVPPSISSHSRRSRRVRDKPKKLYHWLFWHILQELSGHHGSLEDNGRHYPQVISYRICAIVSLSKEVSFCIYINVERRGCLPFILSKEYGRVCT